MDAQHSSGEDYPSLLFIEGRPDDQVGDASLVFDGDEHHAFRRAGHLPHEHEAGGLEPAPVAGLHRLGAGDDAPAAQVLPEERDGMAAQR
jgi:hypothetical protein